MNSSRRYSHFSHGVPYVPCAEREHIILNGDKADRGRLALQPDLSSAHAEAVAQFDDPDTAQLLVFGASTAKSLDLLVQKHPSLRAMAGKDPHASTALKMSIPFYEHSEVNLGYFLDAQDATTEQRRALFREYRERKSPVGLSLGEVWTRLTDERSLRC